MTINDDLPSTIGNCDITPAGGGLWDARDRTTGVVSRLTQLDSGEFSLTCTTSVYGLNVSHVRREDLHVYL